jgi:hypothetical protein
VTYDEAVAAVEAARTGSELTSLWIRVQHDPYFAAADGVRILSLQAAAIRAAAVRGDRMSDDVALRPSPVEIARHLTAAGKEIGAEMVDFVEACRIIVANAETNEEYLRYERARSARLDRIKTVSKNG